MRLKRAFPSIAAGVLTVVALLLLDATDPLGLLSMRSQPAFLTAFLLVLGVSLWPPISPLTYGATIAVIFVAAGFALVAIGGGGNLAGVVVILFAGFGLLIGAVTAAAGSLLRLIKLPRWAAPVIVGVAVTVWVAIGIRASWTRSKQAVNILARVEEIRRAELAYSAGRADHAFTCNGPDLSIPTKIDWQSYTQLGLQEKNHAQIEGHSVTLSCEAAAHSHWVDIVTSLPSGHITSVHVTR